MTQEKLFTNFIKTSGKSALYLTGGIILIVWLITTPSGILGKADAVAYAVCHRIDIRFFHIGIIQLPLCARCTGQYLGAIIGLVFLGLFGRGRSRTPPKQVIAILILLALIYIVDGLNSYLYLPPIIKIFPGIPHLYEPSNILRLFTGTGMGLVLAVVIYPVFVGSIVTKPDVRPVINDLKSLFILIGLGIFVDMLILTGSKYILYPAALISASGVVILLTRAYSIIWIRILHKDNQFTKLSQIISPVIVGFMITMTQIALIDLIRFIITGTWNGILFG